MAKIPHFRAEHSNPLPSISSVSVRPLLPTAKVLCFLTTLKSSHIQGFRKISMNLPFCFVFADPPLKTSKMPSHSLLSSPPLGLKTGTSQPNGQMPPAAPSVGAIFQETQTQVETPKVNHRPTQSLSSWYLKACLLSVSRC